MALTVQERKDRAADRHYANTYGVSLEWVQKEERRLGNKCAICGRPPKARRLCVDHNHRTGRVRSLLCHTCNRKVLGCIEKFRVPPVRIVRYLEQYDPENPLVHDIGWEPDLKTGRPARKKRKK